MQCNEISSYQSLADKYRDFICVLFMDRAKYRLSWGRTWLFAVLVRSRGGVQRQRDVQVCSRRGKHRRFLAAQAHHLCEAKTGQLRRVICGAIASDWLMPGSRSRSSMPGSLASGVPEKRCDSRTETELLGSPTRVFGFIGSRFGTLRHLRDRLQMQRYC